MRIEDLKVGQPLWAIDECEMDIGANALIIGKQYPIKRIEGNDITINSEFYSEHIFVYNSSDISENIETYFSLTPPKSEVSNDAELLAEEQLRQLFKNNSDCYADTDNTDVIQAMTEDKFIEICSEVLTILKSK